MVITKDAEEREARDEFRFWGRRGGGIEKEGDEWMEWTDRGSSMQRGL